MVGYLCGLRKRVLNFFARIIQNLFSYIMNSPPAHEVVPGLWLGNRAAAHDLDFQRQQNITTIFNCTKDITFKQGVAPRMYRIPLDDNLEAGEIRNLETWAWEVAYKISNELGTGNRTLVHCMAGMQRSAAAVAIYLVAKYRCTTDEAIAYIKSKRPVAFLGNANFYKSIKGFEDSLRRMIAEKEAYAQFPKLSLP